MASERMAALAALGLALGCHRPPAPAPLLDRGHHRAAVDATAAVDDALDRAIDGGDADAIVDAAVRASAAARARHHAAIAAAIDTAGLARLRAAAAVMVATEPPAGAIATRLATAAHDRGDRDERDRWLAIARGAPDRDDARLEALARFAPVERSTIAVLLPLTGRYGALGRDLAAAIALAPADGASRVILDTAGDPAGAAAAVDAAVAAGAVAILGPVGVVESDAATARALELGVPIATLAPVDGAARPGVFHLVDSPDSEARAAAAFAAELGVTTVAVLAPDDPVGNAAAQAFATAATAAGLAVTADGRYQPTPATIGRDVKTFLGLDPATNPRLAAHLRRHGKRGWQTFSPDVGFALLYVPDRYDRAALVASFLPYYGVEVHDRDFADLEALARKHGGRIPQVVQLVGSASWNHPSVITRGGDAVEGAFILEPCPLALGEAAATEFVERFQAATRRDPAPTAAAAHDAWRMIASARTIAAAAPEPRATFIRALGAATLDDGACGAATIDRDGHLTRTPTVLKIDAGELVVEPY